MYCRAFACDFDGTGATAGQLAPEIADVLAAARASGYVVLLVTGRVLADLEDAGVPLGTFDAVVAENGAIVWFPRRRRTIRLGGPPPEHFLGALRSAGVAFQSGAVVVGASAHDAATVLGVIRRLGLDVQIAFNRGAAMVLPSGVNKAAGVRRALRELGRSPRNLIAFGDAENDLPLFAVAELAVAARNAVASARAAADEVAVEPGAAGIARVVARVVGAGGVVPTPARRALELGRDDEGRPARLPASGVNVLVSGDPRTGKSWLAGLVVERLLDDGYRLCLIDPEGDHLGLGPRPGVLVLGHDLPLPPADAVPRILRDEPVSLVLNLAALGLAEKVTWVDTLLCGLDALRVRSGIPHWTVIDEAHYFFHEASPCARRFTPDTGSHVFVTYRPTVVAQVVHDRVTAHLVTRTQVDDERYFVDGLLRSRGPRGLDVAAAVAALVPPRAGLLVEGPDGPSWRVFRPEGRTTAHTHHARKYVDARLPDAQAFRFLGAGPGVPAARSVADFYALVGAVPEASLRHHLAHGDFSRWALDVLGDRALAAALQKLERTATTLGSGAVRDEIRLTLASRYQLEDGGGATSPGSIRGAS